MRKIKFEFGSITLEAELLRDSDRGRDLEPSPDRLRRVALGEEVYFAIPVAMEREPDARAVVEAGEIADRPDGHAIAIGFGRSPISAPGEIVSRVRATSGRRRWRRGTPRPVPTGTRVAVSSGVGLGDPADRDRPRFGFAVSLLGSSRTLLR